MYPQAKVPLRKSHATIFIVQVNGATSNGPPLRVSKMELSKILEKIENIVTEAHKILQLLNLPSAAVMLTRDKLLLRIHAVQSLLWPLHV